MRKRDCLYVHALCVLVRRELECRGDLPAETFENYEQLDVRPTAVHQPKTEHKRATFELLDELTDAVDGCTGSVERAAAGGDEPNRLESG